MKTVGIGFIGAGAVSALHAAAVATCPQAKLVGIYDLDPERAQSAAHTYACRQYSTIEELLGDPGIDAVAVLSPVEFHHQHAIQSLLAGKHVLIEKPVANSLEEVQAIAQAAESSEKVCMPAHNYIYAPPLWRMKRLIEAGELGEIVSAFILYTLYHPREVAAKYPGVLRQIMTHHFYSLLYLLGRPSQLLAMATETRPPAQRLDREDQVSLVLKMPNGALVNLFASFAADDQTSDPWTVTYKILGTSGSGLHTWRDAVILSPGVGLSWRYPAYEASIEYEVDYFVRRCILAGEPPLSTIQDAVEAQRLIEAAEESIRTGCIVALA